jgi:SNF2 family DNA or RNA helicase
VWLLTGTPIKNGRPINLFPLLKAIAHPLANNQKEYEEHYCSAYYRPVKKGWVWDNSGAAHLEELSAKTNDVILRRTKDECLDLPPKIRSFKTVELEKEDKKAYKKEIDDLVKDYWKRVREGLVDDGAEALVKINYLRRVGSKYKVREAIAIAEELLEQGEPVVIFSEFIDSAKAVYEALGGELMTGETPVEERSSIVNRFQSGESKVFVATTKTGGTGLTLTAASNVILINRLWTPGDAEQSEDRLHRIGAKKTVNSYWIQLGIIDEAIDSLLESKQERINLVLKGKATSFRGVGTAKELAKELMEILL